VAPIDPFKQIAKLSRRNRHHAIGRRGPDELASFEALRIQGKTEAIMPKDFQKIAFTTPKNVQIAGVWITAQRFLNL
jgi:hypothetical protein